MIKTNIFLAIFTVGVLFFMFLHVNIGVSMPIQNIKIDEDSMVFVKLTGYSMYPTMKQGEIKSCLISGNYSVGDIIAFQGRDQVISHRIVGSMFGKFVTKGDNNVIPDFELVDSSEILCRVDVTV